MKVTFFESQEKFRSWLSVNHKLASELIVGFYKIGTGIPSMTWSQSVNQALCFGWIDGVKRTIDSESYSIRFTPRRNTSNWSAVNIQKMNDLFGSGLKEDDKVTVDLIREELRTSTDVSKVLNGDNSEDVK